MPQELINPGRLQVKTRIIVRKFLDGQMLALDKPYEVSEGHGNLGLNAGIQLLWDVATGVTPATSGFHSGAARVGVGTCSGVAAATDTGLWSGAAYAAMNSGYPLRSGQAVAFQGTFGAGLANVSWQEFAVANASGLSSGGRVALIHKQSNQGTKTSGQLWTLNCEIVMA